MSDMKNNGRAGLNIQQASESFPPVDTLRGAYGRVKEIGSNLREVEKIGKGDCE